jgi:hypothetical protein
MPTLFKFQSMKGLVREMLTANRTYYVSTTGNDTNDGLTVSTPFATIQKAVDTVASIDCSIYNVTIQLADGTYYQNVLLKQYVGAGTMTLQGNSATPANVVIYPTTGNVITLSSSCTWTVKDVKIQAAASNAKGLYANVRGAVMQFGNINFGVFPAGIHIQAENGQIVCLSSYTITGGAGYHFYTNYTGTLSVSYKTITLTGTPGFTTFAYADSISVQVIHGLTFSGSATGKKYDISQNSFMFTLGAGINYLPGSVAGGTASGGIYS